MKYYILVTQSVNGKDYTYRWGYWHKGRKDYRYRFGKKAGLLTVARLNLLGGRFTLVRIN